MTEKKNFKNFGSIEHFKNFLHEVKHYFDSRNEQRTTLSLTGTVKLHGTHADYVTECDENNEWTTWCQSRNRILSIDVDNNGYAAFMNSIPVDARETLFGKIRDIYEEKNPNESVKSIMISGEFCGGNIQKTVALKQLQKMFVIFRVKVNEVIQDFKDYHGIHLEEYDVYNISRAPSFNIVCDLTNRNEMSEQLQKITDNVEKECPFAKTFNVSGTGEGVVWIADELPRKSIYTFKVKGDEHQVSKVKTLKIQSPEEVEKLKNVKIFSENVVLPERLQQGLSYMKEMNIPIVNNNIGTFIKWVVSDVQKEESDSILELGLDEKLVRKHISEIARNFYVNL